MYELNGKVFTSKFVGTGPSSYEKLTYRVAVSQRLRNTVLDNIQHPGIDYNPLEISLHCTHFRSFLVSSTKNSSHCTVLLHHYSRTQCSNDCSMCHIQDQILDFTLTEVWVSSVITHRITTVSASRLSLNLRARRFRLGTGSTIGDRLPLYIYIYI